MGKGDLQLSEYVSRHAVLEFHVLVGLECIVAVRE